MSTGADKPSQPVLQWMDDRLLRIDDVEFYLSVGLDELHSHQSRTNHFLLGKTRRMIEDVLTLRENEDVRKVLDVGIFKGGSAVLYTPLPCTGLRMSSWARPWASKKRICSNSGK